MQTDKNDPFHSLVGSLKKLSLVPRSVTKNAGTSSSSMHLDNLPIGTNREITANKRNLPDIPHPPHPHPLLAQLQQERQHQQFQVKSSDASSFLGGASAASKAKKYGNNSLMWSREKTLGLYLSRIPERAKEAERLWKEQRAARKFEGEKMLVDAVQ
ncbi:hypothetical protein HK100_010892 [Physocladia obscura]|uniref:Uncharacterized protein n=1 Tax=Physocladia obscura TaxID=109957 RepID=A0AAD5XKS9_9FUNG|nr:hypothetical protein HK100_010892 [Physocladia obscura]